MRGSRSADDGSPTAVRTTQRLLRRDFPLRVDIKAKYDPTNLFANPRSILPPTVRTLRCPELSWRVILIPTAA
ncbi:MAG: BBE domain-containing protein [Chloroflexi bacterium]|nr:BBE domain-containing protein [Chloroflexota bacterium]